MPRLHPVTAFTNAASMAVSAGVAGFFLRMFSEPVGLPEWVIPLVIPVLAAVGALFGIARYVVFTYELEPDTLTVRSGVFLRQEREIPLGRVQNVDVTQSIFARALGLAMVDVETAGGGSTEARLAYVTREEGERLQQALRRRARAAEREGAEGAEDGEPAPEDEGRVLFELSNPDLAVLSLISFNWGLVPAILLGLPIFGSFLVDPFVDALTGIDWSPIAALIALLIAFAGFFMILLIAWLVSAVFTAIRYWGFTLWQVGDELRYERGLLERYAGTIPLEKVQTLNVEENVLMRRLGYAALSVETAGYAPGQEGASPPSAVPLADREEVLGLVGSLSEVEELSVDRPPKRARRRYAGRYAIVLGVIAGLLYGSFQAFGTPWMWFAPLLALPLVPFAAHFKWLHRGHRELDTQVLTRDGFWRRTTKIVPYYRLQTVLETRTIFQRRWNLASVTADTAGSASLLGREATAYDIDQNVADRLHRSLRTHLQADLRERRAKRMDELAREAEAEAKAEEQDETEPESEDLADPGKPQREGHDERVNRDEEEVLDGEK